MVDERKIAARIACNCDDNCSCNDTTSLLIAQGKILTAEDIEAKRQKIIAVHNKGK